MALSASGLANDEETFREPLMMHFIASGAPLRNASKVELSLGPNRGNLETGSVAGLEISARTSSPCWPPSFIHLPASSLAAQAEVIVRCTSYSGRQQNKPSRFEACRALGRGSSTVSLFDTDPRQCLGASVTGIVPASALMLSVKLTKPAGNSSLRSFQEELCKSAAQWQLYNSLINVLYTPTN